MFDSVDVVKIVFKVANCTFEFDDEEFCVFWFVCHVWSMVGVPVKCFVLSGCVGEVVR